eukprot:1951993-Prymnesium_polylepis.1
MSPAGHRARESALDARRTRLCEHAAVGKPCTDFLSHVMYIRIPLVDPTDCDVPQRHRATRGSRW